MEKILPQPFTLRARLNSFGYALRGLARFLREEVNARVHLFATLTVAAAVILLPVTRLEILALVIVTGAVWAAEAFNTVIERLVDIVHPQWHPRAGYIKDLAAGAVLLVSLTALAVGAIIFIPKIC